MKVEIKNSVVTISMTTEQFGTLRYTLDAGADCKASRARYFKSMKLVGHKDAAKDAKEAQAVNNELEKATQKFCRNPLTKVPNRKAKEYHCKVYLMPEKGGGFSVRVPGLPGTASQGDNEQEAIANIKEALEGIIQTYSEEDVRVPWIQPSKPKAKEQVRFVKVCV